MSDNPAAQQEAPDFQAALREIEHEIRLDAGVNADVDDEAGENAGSDVDAKASEQAELRDEKTSQGSIHDKGVKGE